MRSKPTDNHENEHPNESTVQHDVQLVDEPAGESDPNVAALMENLRVMVQERDEAREAQLRALADLQNFRRRAQQEKEQLRTIATQSLVEKLLPVLDNFERSVAALEAGASVDAVLEGVRGVDRQLRTALEAVNLTRIPSTGHPFDPEVHEAIGAEPHPELPENTVTLEIEAGYRMGERVVRPAKVKVSTGP